MKEGDKFVQPKPNLYFIYHVRNPGTHGISISFLQSFDDVSEPVAPFFLPHKSDPHLFIHPLKPTKRSMRSSRGVWWGDQVSKQAVEAYLHS